MHKVEREFPTPSHPVYTPTPPTQSPLSPAALSTRNVSEEAESDTTHFPDCSQQPSEGTRSVSAPRELQTARSEVAADKKLPNVTSPANVKLFQRQRQLIASPVAVPPPVIRRMQVASNSQATDWWSKFVQSNSTSKGYPMIALH